MSTISQSEIILEKQITRNRFIALGLLLVFAISVTTAIHYYNKSVTANSNLIIEKQKLVDAIASNDSLQTKLELKKSLEEAKKNQDEAIQLLSVFLQDADSDSSQSYTPEYILKNLTALAKKEEEKINKINKDRKEAIKDLYSTSEPKRKSATDEIIREFGDDKKLVKELLTSVMNEEHFKDEILDKNYSGSYYQVLYILTQLSGTSLLREKKSIVNFQEKMEEAYLYGKDTQDKFELVLDKIDKIKK